ncbi:helix-turn-helix domain-containing protein [Listeria booriae]|uniref:helix-turn-helix domain-containing protein n=1 Tax=Listeria booriae TaxID=1552123 RepID=UPI0035D6EC8D
MEGVWVRGRHTKQGLLEFEIIEQATQGDIDAIRYILDFFNAYISKLATRRLYDELGICQVVVDHDLKSRIESKLISKILEFKLEY